MTFHNSYDDPSRADAYSKLEFSGTYYLAFRDLPEIILSSVKGRKALDFGCGAGRSSMFLQKMGFHTIGVDISKAMLKKARESNPAGDYRLIEECDLSTFENETFDLVLSTYTFDNIPTVKKKVASLVEIRRVMKKEGRMVNLVCSPEMYTHEWTSFSTKDFLENKNAKTGDEVRVQFRTDKGNEEPVVDVFWPDESYREVYKTAGLEIAKTYKPLGKRTDPSKWINETKIPPWVIYLLKKSRV
jgi:ubiquinone/menaquinone biosynthesis C-methylase UbiE